ncbi:MAG TPA: M20 family metallopeptidase [Bradyrhizobium sp.]|nr:M20 family metallopeptidase [Bradyrhizobium sp.]
MNSNERQILDWLASQRGAMLALLETLVNTDSGSYDKAGVDAVGGHVRTFLDGQGIASDVTPDTKFGDAISATVGQSGGGNRPILLMGHCDTVFPKGEPTRRPFKIEGPRAYGPGVSDMKSGLVMNCFILAAFKKFGGAPAPVIALFTGDEEIGSPFSRKVIERFARDARAVFNSEPGRGPGIAVTGRKGGVFMRFEITGKAAHSGANFEAGISAINELAHKTLALHALSDPAKGITLNVGVVSGGQTVNTVAPWAKGEVDLRFITPEQRAATMAEVEAIMAKSFVPGTTAKLEISGEFVPLVETGEGKALFEHYAAGIRELGNESSSIFTGGCADSGFAAATGAPTICGVGPVGGKGHTPEEFMEVDTLVPRAQALALAILRLSK